MCGGLIIHFKYFIKPLHSFSLRVWQWFRFGITSLFWKPIDRRWDHPSNKKAVPSVLNVRLWGVWTQWTVKVPFSMLRICFLPKDDFDAFQSGCCFISGESFNSLLMFSRSVNKVWCVNSLINDVKIELTACGCPQSTIAQPPLLCPYKLCPLSFLCFRPNQQTQLLWGRRQFKCSCHRWREELMWNLLGDQSVLEGSPTPKRGKGLCWPACSLTFSCCFVPWKSFTRVSFALWCFCSKPQEVLEVWNDLRYISAQIRLCCGS